MLASGSAVGKSGSGRAPFGANGVTGMGGTFQIHMKREEGRAHLHVRGDLDLSSASMMELFLEVAQESPAVVVDVQRVDCADSSGIRVLVQTARQMEDSGRRFRIHGASSRVARAFTVLGLEDLLDGTTRRAALLSGRGLPHGARWRRREDRHSGVFRLEA